MDNPASVNARSSQSLRCLTLGLRSSSSTTTAILSPVIRREARGLDHEVHRAQVSWGLPGRLRWPGGNAHRPRAGAASSARPDPTATTARGPHASDKGIKREPYGLSGPPNLSEKDSELTGTCGCGGR